MKRRRKERSVLAGGRTDLDDALGQGHGLRLLERQERELRRVGCVVRERRWRNK